MSADRGFRTGVVIGVLAAAVVGLVIALIVTSGDSSSTSSSTSTITTVINTPTSSIPTTNATTTTSSTTTTTSSMPVAFRSPSGNIICKVSSDQALCSINEFSYQPSNPPASCTDSQGWGHVVGVQGSAGADFICADNQVAEPNSPILAYGRGVLVGSLACGSSQDGVHCANRDTRHGFVISREQVRLF